MANKPAKTLIRRNKPATATTEPEQTRTFSELLEELRDSYCNMSLHVGLASHELEELRMRFSSLVDQLAEFAPEEDEDDSGEV